MDALLNSLKEKPQSPEVTPSASHRAAPTNRPPAPESKPVSTERLAIPIDAEALLVRCMSDVTFAVRLLEKFAERAVVDAERVRAIVITGDAVAAGRVAHNLKSVAAHVSAERLRGISFEIEQAGARGDLQFIEQQLAILDEEARRCASYVPEAIKRIARMRALGSPSSPLR